MADAIIAAADEMLAGKLRDQFVVDIYQAGAGTSHNMNINEVLANRAAETLGLPRGTYKDIHPNDHVNMGQSTNDVFPTATRVALAVEHVKFVEECRALAVRLPRRANEFADVLKVGRTHLQDAVPITLGQEFGGYAACLEAAADGSETGVAALYELNLGATAIGTGLNAGDDYTRARRGRNRASHRRCRFAPRANRFRVTQSMGDVVAYSASIAPNSRGARQNRQRPAVAVNGPTGGPGRDRLPAVQPGSSIMPGKVNPSVPEMVNQVCFQVSAVT